MFEQIYKVNQAKTSAMDRKQTFVYSLWKIPDVLISLVTLGHYGGRYADKYLWAQISVNADRIKAAYEEDQTSTS